jgi:hypothetical protein
MAERSENILTQLPKGFKTTLEAIVTKVLVDHGVKRNSDLIDSVEFSDNSRDSLYMYVNEYYENVSKGRRPRQKKIPIYALITWIRKNNVSPRPGQSLNQLAYVIQRSIYLNGIRGKNFLQTVRNVVTDTVEIEVGDIVGTLVADSLYAAFQVK